jgi:hypothetical protein
VENQENWLILLCSYGILNILLVLLQKFRVELDVSGLVDTVDITESSSNGEIWRDRGKCLVDGKDILWLGVERIVVNVLIVDTIFLSTGDANFLYVIRYCFDEKVIALTISSHCFIGAARFKYSAVVLMLKSTSSSLKSIIWLENRGSPCSLKYFSSASKRPSNQGRSFLAQ